MESNDLTILFITANRVPEDWALYHGISLNFAAGDYPIFTVCKYPVPVPGVSIVDNKPTSLSNIYYQMLRAAKLIKTPFIAIAEDDTLYTKDHFNSFRPPKDAFAYNRHRWSLFTWGEPTYSVKDRISNCSLIAPRELMIEALEERFEKHPNGLPIIGELGKARTERSLGVTIRKSVEFWSENPIVQFNHDFASEEIQRNHRKKRGVFRAYDIPKWGKASELVQQFV